MAQYSFNPNSLATGLNPIGNDWTQRMSAPNASAIAAVTTPIPNGAKAWNTNSIVNGAYIYSLDAVPQGTADCEALLLVRSTGTDDAPGLGVLTRISGNVGSVNGYGRVLRFWGTGANNAARRKWANGVQTSVSEMVVEYVPSTWYWIKMQSLSTTHRWRIWVSGTPEPHSWASTVTDADYLSGTCGIGDFFPVDNGELQVAWFSVGTAGDTAPLPPGLASEADLYAHWKFDETSGTSAADSSLSSNTLTTTDVAWTDGEIDGAASFNGTSSRADCPHHASLQVADEVTLSAWVYPTAVGQSSDSVIAGKGEGLGHTYSFRFRFDRTVRCDIRTDAGNNTLVTTAALPLNEWSHLAVTWNRLAASPNRYIYINGTVAASGHVTDTPRAVQNTSSRFVVGSPYTEAERANARFQGRIDDVRVYKRALPAAEVAALATYHLAPGATTITPIVMNYHQLLRA
jgi:hypothetical protein